ncbi:AraC family transcriptional regulator [Actinopolymorpha sp. B11F2]|uniref:helix-turn-helix domain-containing protein n=1 Tax=Actinopolymorpha sp. B11F2 TaxID=3160862 RepID=UPI0032E4F0A5
MRIGRVVSRWQQDWLDLMRTEGDQVVGTLFGYDRLPGTWALNFPRGLPEHLVYLVVAGSAGGEVAGMEVSLAAGSFFWVTPATPFQLHAAGDAGLTLYRLRVASDTAGCPAGHLVVPGAWQVRTTFDALVIELSGALAFRAERLRALLVVLFSDVFRAAARHRRTPPLDDDDRAAVESYVDARPAERLSAEDLAAVVGLSEDYFVRRFRQTFGLAPRSWLVRRRIQAAMLRLDESSDPVAMVARELGYPDVFLFSRQFKDVTGMSPRAWRARGSVLR